MNYYEHHIGDYDQATAHLTACEDGIYSRLIRWYYASEGPLPNDLKAIQRRVRAHSREERAAVQTVLAEFFELREDGYHQHRCDEGIARFQDKQAKARRSAESRWSAQRTQSEGNANAYANALDDGMRTHMRTQSEGNAPRARPQSPNTNPQTPSKGESPANPPPTDSPGPTLAGAACRLLREAGVQRVNPSDPRLAQLLAQGVTPQQLAHLAAEIREAQGVPKPMAYVLAAMEGRLRDAAAAPVMPPGTAQRVGAPAPGSAAGFGAEMDRLSAAIDRARGAGPGIVVDVEARRVR